MNQKEWKTLLNGPKEAIPHGIFKFRNLAEKYFGYQRGSGMVIHHLRDTEEQRNFNDTYYERWGFNLNGEMRYAVMITKEEHTQIHRLSKETLEKRGKAISIAKTKYTPEELREKKRKIDAEYREKNKDKIREHRKKYYQANKEKVKQKVKEYRESNPELVKERKRKYKITHREHVNEKKREYYRRKKERENVGKV